MEKINFVFYATFNNFLIYNGNILHRKRITWLIFSLSNHFVLSSGSNDNGSSHLLFNQQTRTVIDFSFLQILPGMRKIYYLNNYFYFEEGNLIHYMDTQAKI